MFGLIIDLAQGVERWDACALGAELRGLILAGSLHIGVLPGEHGCVAGVVRIPGLLPEDVYDRQPLCSADGTKLLVAQVRLDNRKK